MIRSIPAFILFLFFSLDLVSQVNCDDLIVSAGADQTVCQGSTGVFLNGSITGGDGAPEYSWTGTGNGTSYLSDPNLAAPEVILPNNFSGTITYTLSGTAGSCQDIDEMILTVTPLPEDPIEIIGPDNICATSNTTFSVAPDPNADTYTWSVDPPMIIASGQGTNVVEVTNPDNTWIGALLCVTLENSCGTSGEICKLITSYPPLDPIEVMGPDTVCVGDIANYNVVPQAGFQKGGIQWSLPPGATPITGLGNSQVILEWNSGPGGPVCVTIDNVCNQPVSDCLDVIVLDNTIDQVGITGPSTACANQSSIYTATSVGSGSQLDWTITGVSNTFTGQGTDMIDVTFAGTGTAEICVTASNECGSTSACSTVEVNDIPSSPVITGATSSCLNTVETYTFTPDSDISNVVWTASPTGTILSGQGTSSISVEWTNTGSIDICVVQENDCGPSSNECITVDVGDVPLVQVPDGNSDVCEGDTEIYSIPTQSNVDDYVWSVPADAVIQSGQGSNEISVLWGAQGGQICIEATNSCGTAGPECLDVAVTPLPDEVIPTGPQNTCTGTTVSYSVVPSPGADSYDWNIPPSGSLISGGGTPTIEVIWNQPGTFDLCVSSQNSCGDSQSSCILVIVEDVPVPPIINGAELICNEIPQTYSTTPSPDITGFMWSVPPDAMIVSGQNTATIQVDWNGSDGGQVCLVQENQCGASMESCIDVTVLGLPDLPVPNGPAVACEGTSVSYSIPENPLIDEYDWSFPSGFEVESGEGTNEITLIAGVNSGSICVTGSNECGITNTACIDLDITVTPTSDFTVEQPVCVGETAIISWTGTSPNGVTFDWDIGNGTITGGNSAELLEVTWSATGEDQIGLTVELNGCSSLTTVQDISISAPLDDPIISCLTDQNSVTFNWLPVEDAGQYLVSLNGDQVAIQDSTGFFVGNLDPGTEVTIEVIAEDAPCGNGISELTCLAQDCAGIDLSILSPDFVCLADGVFPVQLYALLEGDTLSEQGWWSGAGIADTSAGLFNPIAGGAGVGTYQVAFNYEENGCLYQATTSIAVRFTPFGTIQGEDILCLDSTGVFSFQGIASDSANFEWSSGFGDVINDSNEKTYAISWSETGTDSLVLTINDNGCVSNEIRRSVQIVSPPEEPVIFCENRQDGILFTWDQDTAINQYIVYVQDVPVDTLLHGSDSYFISGLENDESVLFALESFGPAACSSVLIEVLCVYNSGPLPPDELPNIPGKTDENGEIMPLSDVHLGNEGGQELRGLFIPNIFSPDGDGQNDQFRIFAEPGKFGPFSVDIFDRFGTRVYSIATVNPDEIAWNGRYREKKLGSQVLFVRVSVKDQSGKEWVLYRDLTLLN